MAPPTPLFFPIPAGAQFTIGAIGEATFPPENVVILDARCHTLAAASFNFKSGGLVTVNPDGTLAFDPADNQGTAKSDTQRSSGYSSCANAQALFPNPSISP